MDCIAQSARIPESDILYVCGIMRKLSIIIYKIQRLLNVYREAFFVSRYAGDCF